MELFQKTESVQSRVKMLEKIVLIEVDEVDTSALKIKISTFTTFWTISSCCRLLTKKYGDHVVFNDANLVIERGQK